MNYVTSVLNLLETIFSEFFLIYDATSAEATHRNTVGIYNIGLVFKGQIILQLRIVSCLIATKLLFILELRMHRLKYYFQY